MLSSVHASKPPSFSVHFGAQGGQKPLVLHFPVTPEGDAYIRQTENSSKARRLKEYKDYALYTRENKNVPHKDDIRKPLAEYVWKEVVEAEEESPGYIADMMARVEASQRAEPRSGKPDNLEENPFREAWEKDLNPFLGVQEKNLKRERSLEGNSPRERKHPNRLD